MSKKEINDILYNLLKVEKYNTIAKQLNKTIDDYNKLVNKANEDRYNLYEKVIKTLTTFDDFARGTNEAYIQVYKELPDEYQEKFDNIIPELEKCYKRLDEIHDLWSELQSEEDENEE